MCGRATNEQEARRIAERMGADISDSELWTPSYNIAPTQPIPVVGLRDGRRALRVMRWGLVPRWSRDAKIAAQCINARAETVAERPAFREAFKKRRCLVVVTGWYEWKAEGGAKVPHWFHGARGELLALAGLWDAWKDPSTGQELRTCSIVTCAPNAIAGAVHDRMPVVLDEAGAVRWIAPDTEVSSLRYLLRACPDDALDVWPVDGRVGSPRYNDQGLIVRAA